MTKRDAFIEDFKKLLERFPDDSSLPQWQFAYRQVIYSMGLKILENFPSDIVGPDPSEPISAPPYPGGKPHSTDAQPGGSGGPGGHPTTVCRLVCVVLEVGSSGKPTV